jgi:site-specific DNA-cytosine methylase
MAMAGVEVIVSVELDVENREYSESCKQCHEVNFPDADFYLNEVGAVADLLPGCDILQASTVCSHFSLGATISGAMQETLADTGLAKDTATAIARCNAPYFLLEQVPGYQDTRSLEIIVKVLQSEGYKITTDVLDCADYGIAQNRKRFFLLATRGTTPWGFPLPSKKQLGWREAIAGIKLEPSSLTQRQQSKLLKSLDRDYDLSKGVLIQRIGLNTSIRRHTEPCWTITRSSFTDGKGGARGTTINVVNYEGVWSLPMRAIARLAGFPDSFALIGKHIGQGLGYSVPPRLIKQILDPVVKGHV